MDFLVATIGLVAGALLGYFGERLRRAYSLVDRRLDAADQALNIISRLGAGFYRDQAAAAIFHTENAGLISAGYAAAEALGGEALRERTSEALVLLNSLVASIESDEPDWPSVWAIRHNVIQKVAEARKEYEDLRTNLFKLF